MKSLAVALLVLMLSFPVFAEDKKVNYCHDPETWTEWEELAKEFPKDIPLQIMHALLFGLCTKIEQGTITYKEAVALMNDMMENLKAQLEGQELPEKEAFANRKTAFTRSRDRTF